MGSLVLPDPASVIADTVIVYVENLRRPVRWTADCLGPSSLVYTFPDVSRYIRR